MFSTGKPCRTISNIYFLLQNCLLYKLLGFVIIIFLLSFQVANTGMMKEICWSKKNAKSFDNIPLRLTPTGNPSSVDLTLKTTANDSNTWPRR